MNDLRYALRSLWKSPAFSIIAIATLALGIGANTAIFSVIESALLRPLPFPNAHRLVRVYETFDENGARSIAPRKRSSNGANAGATSSKGLARRPARVSRLRAPANRHKAFQPRGSPLIFLLFSDFSRPADGISLRPKISRAGHAS